MGVLFDKLCQSSTLLAAWKIVKQKGSAGGVDGFSVQEFDENIGRYLNEIQQSLKAGTWKPEPYLRISIPKNENEKRRLGLLCIKDKVVQQGIKVLIEPRFEKVFVKNSFGYRPAKGHTRAIKYARFCCQNKRYPFILRLDIDNYFDTINHEILFRRIRPLIADDEVQRLTELCVKMGVVNKKLQWDEVTEGVPQGAVLSPILANHYLHSFDQYVLSKTEMYVRYADDFIICCQSKEEAEKLLNGCTDFLKNRLKLHLNTPLISEVKNGFEFLGITINNKALSLSEEKQKSLHDRINELDWKERFFTEKGLKHLQGIRNYYAVLLPQSYLTGFDAALMNRLKEIINNNWRLIPNKTTLQIALKSIDFFAEENILQKGKLREEIVNCYLLRRSEDVHKVNQSKNKKLIKQRKQEYRKRENEATELIINTCGTFIGVSNKGITLKTYGKQLPMPPTNNLSHITVTCDGVSISSNAIGYCMQNKIPIDFFSSTGHHTASILSNMLLGNSLWKKQAMLTVAQRASLGQKIIYGKLKNQLNLIKYFHKYHKTAFPRLTAIWEEVEPQFLNIIKKVNSFNPKFADEGYRTTIMGFEAAGSILYWKYIRELVSDDEVQFQSREHKGATDLMNSLLNYGYSILYARIWQALLHRRLNPMDSVLHVQQPGKPTFVYDVIELFRSQAVDRVVISLIQKGEKLKMNKNLLSDATKKLLVQNILERINRHELYRGRDCRLCDIINLQAREIADFIDCEKTYRPYIAKW